MYSQAQRQLRIRIERAAEAERAALQVALVADLLCGHAQMLLDDARRMRAVSQRNHVVTRLLAGAATAPSAPTLTEAVAS